MEEYDAVEENSLGAELLESLSVVESSMVK
jgi:hypothetical protein